MVIRDGGKIERAWMNGKHREVFVADHVVWPNGLTIDQKEDRLFWCDSFLDIIEVINLDGSGRKVGLLSHLAYLSPDVKRITM